MEGLEGERPGAAGWGKGSAGGERQEIHDSQGRIGHWGWGKDHANVAILGALNYL